MDPAASTNLEVRFHSQNGTGSSDQLYVSGLPVATTEEEVSTLFGICGSVVGVNIISTGVDSTALVQMSSEEEAQAAIEVLNDHTRSEQVETPMQEDYGGEEQEEDNDFDAAPAEVAYAGVEQDGHNGVCSSAGTTCTLEVRYHGPPRGAMPSDNLYCRGLPPSVGNDEVMAKFAQYGHVVSVRVLPPKPPATDSVALVRMTSQTEAASAIAGLNGTAVGFGLQSDANIQEVGDGGEAYQDFPATQVDGSEPSAETPAKPTRKLEVQYNGPPNSPPCDSLFVKGLYAGITREEVTQIFSECGTVVNVRLMPGTSETTGLVVMSSIDEAAVGISVFDGSDCPGRPSHGPPQKRARETTSYTGVDGITAPGSQLLVRYQGPMNCPPSVNLYTKGLKATVTEDQLRAAFGQCGTVVSVRIKPTDADAIALVRMGTEREAEKAIKLLNGKGPARTSQGTKPSLFQPETGARNTTPDLDQAWSSIQVRFHGPANGPAVDMLHVTGFPANATDDDLRVVFGEFGPVREIDISRLAKVPTAVVRMSSVAAAQAAVSRLGPAPGATAVGPRPVVVIPRVVEQPRPVEPVRRVVVPPRSGVVVPPVKPMAGGLPMPVLAATPRAPPPSIEKLHVRYHGPPNAPPSDNLYVKGLPASITDSELRQVCAPFGTVISTRIMPSIHDATALVRMGSSEEATEVILASGGGFAAEVPSSVPTQAEPQPSAIPPGGIPGLEVRFYGPADASPSENLHVKGLLPQVSDGEVADVFRQVGQVVSVQIIPGTSDASALVQMGSVDDASRAVEQLSCKETMARNRRNLEPEPKILNGLQVRYHGGVRAPPSINLYIKGVPSWATDRDVKATCEQFGTVTEVRVMRTSSDATALVKMSTVEEASLAIDMLNASSQPSPAVQPREVLEVPTPTPRPSPTPAPTPTSAPSRAPTTLNVRYHGPKGSPPSDNLYVRGLPAKVREVELRNLFSQCGAVLSVRIIPTTHDATALVRMSTVDEALVAIETMDGQATSTFWTEPEPVSPGMPADVGGNAVLDQSPYISGDPEFGEDLEYAYDEIGDSAETDLGLGPEDTELDALLMDPAPAPVPTSAPVQSDSVPSLPGMTVRFHGPRGAPPSDNLYISGLDPQATEATVRKLFGFCGTVVSVRLVAPRPPARHATAFVRMGSIEEADYAIGTYNTAEEAEPGPLSTRYDALRGVPTSSLRPAPY